MNLSYGSKGDEVKELQTLLNNNGYTLDVDGDFGTNTLSAVRDYQTKNNLDVDGIVGEKTWGALNKQTSTDTSSTIPQAPDTNATTTPTAVSKGFEYKPYEKSDVVANAEALLQQHLANKPGAYTSPWQTQLNEILDKIMNREEFSYDLNGDMLYHQYKDQAVTNGKMAAMDVMGQAQTMTGGYGNTYAQAVGQQTYQGYLQQLNDRIPELYQLALDQYNREGDDMYNQASLMASMEDQDYGRYRDQLNDYNAELDRITEDARYQGELDYGKWADGREYAYNMYLNNQNNANAQYDRLVSMITTLGYDPTDEELAAAGMSREQFQAYKDYYDKLNPASSSSGVKYIDNPYTGPTQDKNQERENSVNPYHIESFEKSLHSEAEHDAVMRDMYGSYRQYVAEQIENSRLTDGEKAHLIVKYGITESDTNYKPKKTL